MNKIFLMSILIIVMIVNFIVRWKASCEKVKCFSYTTSSQVDSTLPSFTVWYSNAQHSQPFILFIPGKKSLPSLYSTLLSSVAKNGYTVLALKIPLEGQDFLSDEALLNQWATLVHHVLDNLKHVKTVSRIAFDEQRIGIMGHSLGGSVALRICRERGDLKAGINNDGGLDYAAHPLQEFNVPFMFILQDPELENPSAARLEVWNMSKEEYQATMKQHLYNITTRCNNMQAPSYILTLLHSGHNSFSDISLMPREQAVQLGYDIGTISGKCALDITSAYVTAFFDMYLKNNSSPLLEQIPLTYPEVELKRFSV